MTLTRILLIPGVVAAVILLGFSLIVFPVMAFVDCTRNPGLSRPSKMAWGCLIFFTWSIGAAVYYFAATKRPLFKALSVLALVVIGTCFLIPPVDRPRSPASPPSLGSETRLNAYNDSTWKYYEHLYAGGGMLEVWTYYQSGRCEEGKQLLDQRWPQYRDFILSNGGVEQDVKVLRRMAVDGFGRCARFSRIKKIWHKRGNRDADL